MTVPAIFEEGIEVGPTWPSKPAFAIRRLVGHVADATGRTVEEVFEAETAAALHEQVIVAKIHEAMNEVGGED